MLVAGKSVLITGAAQRIGAEIARTLHENGANLIIHYRHSHESAERLAEQLNKARADSAISIQADLNEFVAIDKLAKDAIKVFDGLDILINSASSFNPSPLGKIRQSDWDDLMNSNCRAPLFLSQSCRDSLAQNNGVIINMLDIYAQMPLRDHSIYCAAKAASQMLVKSLALELAPQIRVNGISPGAILWPQQSGAKSQQAQQSILDKIPLQRTGDPGSIAGTVLFIIENDYLTGEVIRVDGGRLLNSL